MSVMKLFLLLLNWTNYYGEVCEPVYITKWCKTQIFFLVAGCLASVLGSNLQDSDLDYFGSYSSLKNTTIKVEKDMLHVVKEQLKAIGCKQLIMRVTCLLLNMLFFLMMHVSNNFLYFSDQGIYQVLYQCNIFGESVNVVLLLCDCVFSFVECWSRQSLHLAHHRRCRRLTWKWPKSCTAGFHSSCGSNENVPWFFHPSHLNHHLKGEDSSEDIIQVLENLQKVKQ